MNNRMNRMDKFIKYIAEIARYNPDFQINTNLVYGELIINDIDYEDRKYDISYFFDKWIERFKNVPNIDVKNTENWKYFCQFNNYKNMKNFKMEDAIKMYIPLKAEYIYEGANMIFDFLSQENIEHLSKIGSEVRMDNIVVRVFNVNDAMKLQQFIINNNYIRNGLLKSNPFALTDGLIAYACDGNISYNNEISRYISDYINYLRDHNALNIAGVNTFIDFINQKTMYYNTKEGIEELKDIYSSKYKALSACEVIDLIKTSLNDSTNVTEVINHFNRVSDKNNKNQRLKNIEMMLNQDIEKNKHYLFIAINETVKKYNKKQAVEALFKYVNEGEARGFTSNNDARNIIKLLSANDIEQICLNALGRPLRSKLEIIELVDVIINSKSDTEKLQFTNYLEKACYETQKKYGFDQATTAIRNAIENGNYKFFTSENNARKQLENNINPGNISMIVTQTLVNMGVDLSCGYPIYIDTYVKIISEKYLDQNSPKR